MYTEQVVVNYIQYIPVETNGYGSGAAGGYPGAGWLDAVRNPGTGKPVAACE